MPPARDGRHCASLCVTGRHSAPPRVTQRHRAVLAVTWCSSAPSRERAVAASCRQPASRAVTFRPTASLSVAQRHPTSPSVARRYRASSAAAAESEKGDIALRHPGLDRGPSSQPSRHFSRQLPSAGVSVPSAPVSSRQPQQPASVQPLCGRHRFSPAV